MVFLVESLKNLNIQFYFKELGSWRDRRKKYLAFVHIKRNLVCLTTHWRDRGWIITTRSNAASSESSCRSIHFRFLFLSEFFQFRVKFFTKFHYNCSQLNTINHILIKTVFSNFKKVRKKLPKTMPLQWKWWNGFLDGFPCKKPPG